MSNQSAHYYRCLERLSDQIFISFLCLCLLSTSAPAQTNCTAHHNCINEVSGLKLTGNLTYSFDEQSLINAFEGNTTKIQDFKNRVTAAAQDWASRTNRSISESTSGSTSQVTIKAEDSAAAFEFKGQVKPDPANNSRRIMTISADWSGWSPEGRDYVAGYSGPQNQDKNSTTFKVGFAPFV